MDGSNRSGTASIICTAAWRGCAEAMPHSKHVKEIERLSFMETNYRMDVLSQRSVIGKVRGSMGVTRPLPLQKLTILRSILVESIVFRNRIAKLEVLLDLSEIWRS